MSSEERTGPLSWFSSHELFRHESGIFFGLLRAYDVELPRGTVRPEGKKSISRIVYIEVDEKSDGRSYSVELELNPERLH